MDGRDVERVVAIGRDQRLHHGLEGVAGTDEVA
jgi:hypothetical protein